MNVEKDKKIKEKLGKSSVGIAGAGGLGSNAAVSLARAGVGRLVIVDFDKVEESNLNRQYYFRDQIGKNKVDALKENINRIYPFIRVDVFNEKLVKGSMDKYFHDVDVIIEALDSAEMKTAFVEEILRRLPGKPVVAASGVAGYGHSDRITTKKLGNLYMVYDGNARSSEEDVLMAPRVCLMANWEANLVLEILLSENK
ncbi:MAG TPA: sulfur carrier protein ThiS adenylyltransferase ThiF [Thermoplasmatales archaeon]|nr:sulfur carrier protein ThiS adenylyltransferase ThiF [Thermoplasmatales archaeon]